eukprot:189928_1
MCLGRSFKIKDIQFAYELRGFRRVGIYGLIQLILSLVGVFIILFGANWFDLQWMWSLSIGLAIIIICNIAPNGRPFCFNLYQMGRQYILFDANLREIYLVRGRFGGCVFRKELICSYSQFRGIAAHYKTKQMLFLCKRKESLLLQEIGDTLPNKKHHKPNQEPLAEIETILEEISLFWFGTNDDDMNCFFGVTYLPFHSGIVAEGNVSVNVDYDYYLKPDKKLKDLDDDGVVIVNENDEFERFTSVQGASTNVASDEECSRSRSGIVDYV